VPALHEANTYRLRAVGPGGYTLSFRCRLLFVKRSERANFVPRGSHGCYGLQPLRTTG